jgi:DNA-binding FadR family transcriptional regulator
MHDAVAEWLMEQREISGRTLVAFGAAYSAHERIFSAIAAHHPAMPQAEMQRHLDEVARLYWQVRKVTSS